MIEYESNIPIVSGDKELLKYKLNNKMNTSKTKETKSDYYICSECGELIPDGDFNYMSSSEDDFGRMCSICFDNKINKD